VTGSALIFLGHHKPCSLLDGEHRRDRDNRARHDIGGGQVVQA